MQTILEIIGVIIALPIIVAILLIIACCLVIVFGILFIFIVIRMALRSAPNKPIDLEEYAKDGYIGDTYDTWAEDVDDEEPEDCYNCQGTGVESDGRACTVCGGEGKVT